MNLRPHHLLCSQGYSGKGYDSKFIDNMTCYVRQMRTDPDFLVRITLGTDALCSACPNRRDADDASQPAAWCADDASHPAAWCVDDEKVLSYDKKVFELLDLADGKVYSYQDLIRRLDRLMNEEKFESICGNCSWYPISACRENVFSGKYLL